MPMKDVLLPFGGSTPETLDDSVTLGWHPLNICVTDLITAFENDYRATNNNNDLPPVDHAIPSPLAYMVDFTKKIKNTSDPKAVTMWEGIICMIALNEVYGFNVTTRIMDLSEQNGRQTFLQELISDALGIDFDCFNGNANALLIFERNGCPIAIFHPDTLICPFKKIDKAKAFSGINWFNAQDGWQRIDEVLFNQSNAKDNWAVAHGLYNWLGQFGNVTAAVNLRARIGAAYAFDPLLQQNVTADGYAPLGLNQVNNTNNSGFAYITGLCAGNNALSNRVNVLNSLTHNIATFPANFFSDLLAICREDSIKDPDDKYKIGTGLYVIEPLTMEVVTHPQIEVLNVQITPDVSSNAVNVSAQFQLTIGQDGKTASITIEKTRRYAMGTDIYFVNSLPIISEWPYVNVADAYWSRYFVGVFKNDADSNLPQNNLRWIDNGRTPVQTLLSQGGLYAAPDVDIEVFEYDKTPAISSNNSDNVVGNWEVYYTSKFPSVISLSTEIANKKYTLGVFTLDRNSAEAGIQDATVNTRTIGVDFGTTSTNCYIDNPGGNPVAVPANTKGSWTKFLTDFADKNVRKDGYEPGEIIRRWQSDQDRGDMFHTACKMFGNQQGQIDPYLNGCVLYMDKGTLADIKDDEFVKSGRNNLEACKYYTSLKFPPVVINGANLDYTDARKTFLATVIVNAALAGRMDRNNPANGFKLALSYPNQSIQVTMQQEMRQIINSVNNIVGSNTFNTNNVVYQSESYCAGQYYVSNNQAYNGPGYVVVDIGGGTTDISLWQDKSDANGTKQLKCVGSTSVKYAGREIMLESLDKYLRPQNKDIVRSLFLPPKPQGQSALEPLPAYDNYFDYIIANPNPNPNDSTVYDFVEDLISQGNFTNEDTIANLHGKFYCVVRLKLLALFYVIGKYVESRIVSQSDDDKLVINQANVHNVLLAGSGSKSVPLVGFANNSVLSKIFAEVSGLTAVQHSATIQAPAAAGKPEVVTGLVNYAVNAGANTANANNVNTNVEPTVAGGTIPQTTNDYDQYYAPYDAMLDAIEKQINISWFNGNGIGYTSVKNTNNDGMLQREAPFKVNQGMKNEDYISNTIMQRIFAQCNEIDIPECIQKEYVALKIFDALLNEYL